ncbi:MAG TPA: DUF3800 domain-containing protein [Sedimentisphaerales bacterium]|nr:DUF3800 domain-containing protein [Sedimentisphaerales bacterium]
MYTHVAFADESNWNKGRYRSIALVSAIVEDARIFHNELDAIREDLGTREFKWVKANQRQGITLADFFFERCDRMRVDVLIWDIEDSRHSTVSGRDDYANFARMYYHLFRNVLKKRWPDGSSWLICPDEQKAVDWLTLERCLYWKRWASDENLLTQCGEIKSFREFYNIQEIRLVSSNRYLLVQLADMFAGLSTYSYPAVEKYFQWKEDHDVNLTLFDSNDLGLERIPLSKSDEKRLPILHHICQESEKRKFQVSVKLSRGLYSANPRDPLNFWLYIPQRIEDKAPVKQRLQHA